MTPYVQVLCTDQLWNELTNLIYGIAHCHWALTAELAHYDWLAYNHLKLPSAWVAHLEGGAQQTINPLLISKDIVLLSLAACTWQGI